MKIAYVTNIIPPYMHHVFEAVPQADPQVQLRVFYCVGTEPGRAWQTDRPHNYSAVLLAGLRIHLSYTQHIYFNPGIWRGLCSFAPDVVVVSSYSPTMLLAAMWASFHRRPFCVATDGWSFTDPGEWSTIHRLVRKALIPRASMGLGASDLSLDLLERYGLKREYLLKMPLVPAVPLPATVAPLADRTFDVLWCGNIDDERKGVIFFARVAAKLKQVRGRLRVRVAGDGPLRDWLKRELKKAEIEFLFDGYLQPTALTEFYSSGRLFLFPSRGDPWGLVVNEAMIAGTPIIASDCSASGIELAKVTAGVVCLPLDEASWTSRSLAILEDAGIWETLSRENFALATQFSTAIPATTIADAARKSIGVYKERSQATA